jgi:hypothetical protein
LKSKAPSKVRQIFDAFSVRLEKFEDISGMAEQINIPQNELNTDLFPEMNMLLICMTTILKINIVLSHNSFQEQKFGVTAPIPEETFEKMLRFLHIFFVTNLGDSRKSVTSSSSGGKEKGKGTLSAKSSSASLKTKDSVPFLFKQFLVSIVLLL